MNEATEYLKRQSAALMELIEKKDAYITRLQDEVSQKSQLIHTVRTEQNNFRNTVKDLVLELVQEGSLSHEDAQKFAEVCDFELTKTLTITATVDFEVEVEVPFDTDADEVIASLEYSVDAFDYSITDFSLDTRNVDWSDSIS
jgi:sugar-specific transcriptional regulator TrmB